MGSCKNCVKKHKLIIIQFHNTIMRQMGYLNGWYKWWNKVCISMGFKRAMIEIGIYNYHGKLWGIGVVDMFFLCHSHHFFYCLIVSLKY
jgi:hypothetical protein